MARIQNTVKERFANPDQLSIWEGAEIAVSQESLKQRFSACEPVFFGSYSNLLLPLLDGKSLISLRQVSKHSVTLVNDHLERLRAETVSKIQEERIILDLWSTEDESCILRNSFLHMLSELGPCHFFTIRSIRQFYISEIDKDLVFSGMSDLSAASEWPPYKDGHLITASHVIQMQMIRRLPFLEKTVIRFNQPLEIVALDEHFKAMPWISDLVMKGCRDPLVSVSEGSFIKGFVQAGIADYTKHFVSLLCKCTNLEQLVMKDDIFLPQNLDDLPLNSLLKLKKLVIEADSLSTGLLQQFFLAAPNLDSLYLIFPELQEGNIFVGLAPQSLPRLTKLWIKGWQEASEDLVALKEAAPLFETKFVRGMEESVIYYGAMQSNLTIHPELV